MRHVVIDTPLPHLRINVHARGDTVFSTLHPSGAHQGDAAKVFALSLCLAYAKFPESAIENLHCDRRSLYATLVAVALVGVFGSKTGFWRFLCHKNPPGTWPWNCTV